MNDPLRLRCTRRCASTSLPLMLALAASPGLAGAEDAGAWSWTATPYVWTTGLSGSLRPFAGAPTLRVSQSIGDVIDDVDGAFSIAFDGERGRVVVLTDVSRVRTSRAGSLPNSLPATGRTRHTSLMLAAGWRVHEGADARVDVFGGLRAFELKAEVEVAGGALSVSPRREFVDPILGARAAFALGERWSARLYADAGGFGTGSKSVVLAEAALAYAPGERSRLTLGLRSLWIDYDRGGTRVDVRMTGPVLGAGWRF